METDTVKIFGCPVCGFRIARSETVCPRCNHKLDESTKLECPFCGQLVERNAKECPYCHIDYDEFRHKNREVSDSSIDELLADIMELESVHAKEEPKRLSCPDCSWPLDGTESRCPKCGRNLAGEVIFQCPACGASVSQDASACPECGAQFALEKTAGEASGGEAHPGDLEGPSAEMETAPREEPAAKKTRKRKLKAKNVS